MTKDELINWIHDQLQLASDEGDLDIDDLDCDDGSVVVTVADETLIVTVKSDLDDEDDEDDD